MALATTPRYPAARGRSSQSPSSRLGASSEQTERRTSSVRQIRFSWRPLPASRRELEALLQDTGARQNHQNLIVGHACAFVHAAESVEQADDLPLVEERNRGERSATQPILHKIVELRVGIQSCRRTHERMLLPAVDGIGDDVAYGLAQHVLLGHAAYLEASRL